MSQSREDKVAAAKARMAELAAKFVERSSLELGLMRDNLAKLTAGEQGNEPEALDSLRHLAHRMSGTGATLGFDSLADCAARIEQLAGSSSTGGLPDADVLNLLEAGIGALGTELARLEAAEKRSAGS
jgi:HPt (histidine-containing phosphotransfer) domain-containing protein